VSSTSIITIPAGLLPLLRSGAQVQAGRAAEAFSYSSERLGREERSEWFLEPRRLMDGYTELLDVVGWVARRPEQDIVVDPDYHGQALASALEGQLEIERYRHADGGWAARWRAGRNMRRIRRFLVANELVPRAPRAVTVGRWLCRCGRALVVCVRRPLMVLHRGRRGAGPEAVQESVLGLLLEDGAALRSVGQLARRVGGRKRAREAVAELRKAGLVHTIGNFVCPTIAAETFHELDV